MIFNQYKNVYDDIVYNIKFSVYEDSTFFSGYAYDTDRLYIALNLLKNDIIYDLVFQEIYVDWQDAIELSSSLLIDDTLKHSLRIAMLINLIESGMEIHPVSIDTYSRSLSCLEGHHRLLALRHIGYSTFPAYLSGNVDELESELKIEME